MIDNRIYARVLQADGESYRNVLLGRRRTIPGWHRKRRTHNLAANTANAFWTEAEIKTALATLGLDEGTPLTFLAIELLPEPNGAFADPVGGDLGEVRVLRTSRLVSAGNDCCA